MSLSSRMYVCVQDCPSTARCCNTAAMRTQLQERDKSVLSMCPVVHNISGQLTMSHAIRDEYINGTGKVCQRKNFGNTRCMYSVVGNVLFRPGKLDMVFKGVRSVPAMCSILKRSTHGSLLEIRVSMMVMTVHLHKEFTVCEQCPLQQKLANVCGSEAIYMLPRTEEESNALMFRIDDWQKVLHAEGSEVVDVMNTLTSIVSISRLGNCTLRTSSPSKGPLRDWLRVQRCVNHALCGLSHFIVDLEV
jgi:hypothetical protein